MHPSWAHNRPRETYEHTTSESHESESEPECSKSYEKYTARLLSLEVDEMDRDDSDDLYEEFMYYLNTTRTELKPKSPY